MGGLVLTLGLPLPAGQLHQLAATFTPDEGGTTGALSFFVDGALVGTNTAGVVSAGSSPPHLIAGSTSAPVGLRRIWLTPTVVPPADDLNEAPTGRQMPDTRFGGTGTAPVDSEQLWDWGQLPAAFTGVAAPTPLHGASPAVTTPGLQPGGAGSATFTLVDAAFDAFSVQGWFWFPASPSSSLVNRDQNLIQVGQGSAFGLSVSLSTDGTWSINGHFGTFGGGRSGLSLSGWHNIAVTWSGGAGSGQSTLYLDGVRLAGGTQGDLRGVVPTAVTLGGPGDGAPASAASFCGVIQSVTLWDTELDASTLAEQMKPWFPLGDVDPVAVFDFTTDPALELVTGETLSFTGTAALEHRLWPTSAFVASTVMLAARPPRPDLTSLRPLRPPTADPSLYSEARESELLASLRQQLARAGEDPRVATLRPALEERLRARFARGRAGDADLRGLVHTEKQGEDWVTFYYGESGPVAVYRRRPLSLKQDNSCFNWMLDFTATALFGLLDIMGVPLSTGAATKALEKLLGKAKIWEAIGEVLESTLTTDSVIAVLKAINDGGGVKSFVKAVLDDVSWWDFLWMVAQVVIELVGLLVPGLEEAIIAAKCVLLVVQLSVVLSHQPAGCPV